MASEKWFWNATATVAACATRRAETTVDHCSSSRAWQIGPVLDDLSMHWLSRQSPSNKGCSVGPCRPSFFSSGGSSTRKGMSKPDSVLQSRSQCLSRRQWLSMPVAGRVLTVHWLAVAQASCILLRLAELALPHHGEYHGLGALPNF